MVEWNPEIMSAAAAALHRLADDRTGMQSAGDFVRDIPLPTAESAAARALSNRPEIVDAATVVVSMVGDELDTVAANIEDTLAAYERGEAENTDAINKLWNDIGESTARNYQLPEEQHPVVPMRAPSTLIGAIVAHNPPSDLPYRILDMAEFLTSIPTDRREILTKLQDLIMLPIWQEPTAADWYKIAVGEYQPISQVGDGYRQMGDAYVQAAEQLQYLGDAVCYAWTGDSARLAENYFYTLYSWMRWEVAEGFHFVGAQYQDVADSLFLQAERAAGFVAGYKEVLTGLYRDFILDALEGLTPSEIVFKEVIAISKTAAERLLVINTILKVLQIALDVRERLRLGSKVTPMTLQPPRRQ